MAVNSPSMNNFRASVLRIIAETPGLSISGLAVKVSVIRTAKNEDPVSRPFLSNLLNGRHACTIPFAEDVAEALGASLSDLLDGPAKKSRRRA